MRIPAPPTQSWRLTDEEVGLVKNYIAKGATDEELKFCLAVARRRKLDPFKGQIWFVKRRDDKVQGGYRWIPITGIDGLCHLAARDHKDYGSNDEPEFGPMATVSYQYNGQGPTKTITAPEWAKIAVWKKGAERPTVATVYWSEIYPNIDYSPTVREKPRLMLGKCALAQAIRRAYPDTGGIYIPEEFQGPEEFTPQGRQIVYQNEKTIDVGQRPIDCSYCGKLEAPNGCAEANCPIRRDPNYLKFTPEQKKIVDQKISQATKSSQRGSAETSTDSAAGQAGAPNSPGMGGAPVLTYLWFDRSGTARVDPPTFPLMADMKAILQKLLKQGIVAPNGEELDALRYECDKRGIQLKRRYQ